MIHAKSFRERDTKCMLSGATQHLRQTFLVYVLGEQQRFLRHLWSNQQRGNVPIGRLINIKNSFVVHDCITFCLEIKSFQLIFFITDTGIMRTYSSTPKQAFKSDETDDANVTQSQITNTEKNLICLLALKIKLSLSFNALDIVI